MRFYLIVPLFFVVSGCNASQGNQARYSNATANDQITNAAPTNTGEAVKKYHLAMAQCGKEAITKKNVMRITNCKDAALIKLGEDINFKPSWIVYDHVSADIESAANYSEGKISHNEFEAQMMANKAKFEKNKADVAKERRQQQALDSQQQALAEQQRRQQSDIEAMQMYQILQGAQQPRYNAAPAMNTNCVQTGEWVQCQTY
jgi:hypothetical protein